MAKPLWENQKQTIDFALERDAVFDMSDPGTGKTRAHLDVFQRLKEVDEIDTLFVFCPKTLMQTAWGDDIDEYFPRMFYACAYAANRENALNSDSDVYIVNNDGVKWLAKQPKSFWKKYGRIAMVGDESADFKNKDSGRSKAIDKIIDNFSFRTLTTATPNPKSVTELWHQAWLLDGGQRLGTSYYKFRSAVCNRVQVGPSPNMVEWRDKPGAEEAVSQLLADITIRHQFEDCMDIPPNFERFVNFDPPAKLLRQYQKMEAEALLELEKGEVVGINAAVLANKLCQIASGAVYHNDGSYTVIDDSRSELIADVMLQHRHTVTFFNWSHQKEQLAATCKKRGIEYEILDSSVSDKRRSAIRTAYQRGDLQTLLLHPKTGAHGLTLTRGVATIWSSPVHEADFVKQGKHRIYRGGQTQKTYTKKICATGTCDRHVYDNAEGKGKRMSNLLNILRQRRGEAA